MAERATGARTLSVNESRVILDLEWRDERSVTLSDLRALLECSEPYARFMAHQLVKKGWLERLKPGLFRLIPADRGREAVFDTNPLAAGALLVSPYFFSFGTACTYHGFTEQAFAEVYIACRRSRPPEIIRGMQYVFVQVGGQRFFGFEEASVLGEVVLMATPERALLDALDRPRYAGGIGEVSRMVARASARLSWDALLAALRRWNQSALVQRLGYLVELHQVELPTDVCKELEALVRPSSKVLLGARGRWGTSGRLAIPWNVIVNVPHEVLMETGGHPRRRVVLGSGDWRRGIS